MNIAFVGCGYVFDIYMRSLWAHPEISVRGVFDIDGARLRTVCEHYGFRAYPSLEAVLDDPEVDTVVNLTSIRSHFEVTRRALEAGKHVYSEKPITLGLEQSRALFELAAARGRVLTGAPSNVFSDSVVTMWRAVQSGAIGRPVLVYAELDDNPAHLMQLEMVRSPTGAPFPYEEELQEGCTIEHVGYHLVWLCAMFGPVVSVTAFSSCLVPTKTATPLSPPDTPDLSVGCLAFANGVAARVTCSWVAPRDHRFRIVGEAGEISADNVFHDQSAVRLERFSRVSLAARKSFTLRNQPVLGRLFGIGGRRLPLLRRWKSHGVEAERGPARTAKQKLVAWLRRREVYAQDKILGIAEMARALRDGRPQPLPPDFLLHLNELMILIQGAGRAGVATVPRTSFAGPLPPPDHEGALPGFAPRPALAERAMGGIVRALHKR